MTVSIHPVELTLSTDYVLFLELIERIHELVVRHSVNHSRVISGDSVTILSLPFFSIDLTT